MKVLRVINSMDIGGAERSIAGNVPLHIKNGIKMDVLLLNGRNTYFTEQLIRNNVKIFSLGINNNIYNPFLIFKIIKYLKGYDIVHVHLFPALYWVAIAKMFSFSNAKLVFTEHSTLNRRRSVWWLKYIDKIIYKKYDTIISISDAVEKNLKKYLSGNHVFVTIYNGVDLAALKNEAEIFNSIHHEVFNGKKILIHIASFRKQKDQDTLIRALSILPEDYIAVFIGEGSRVKICKDLAISLNISNRVFFLGLQSNVGAYINISHIVVMSSIWEGFGRAAIEGMALKKPVIASNVPGLRDIVKETDLLFEVGDYRQLATLVLKISENKKLYDEIAEKCYKRAQKYDIDKMVSSYEQVYYSLLEDR